MLSYYSDILEVDQLQVLRMEAKTILNHFSRSVLITRDGRMSLTDGIKRGLDEDEDLRRSAMGHGGLAQAVENTIAMTKSQSSRPYMRPEKRTYSLAARLKVASTAKAMTKPYSSDLTLIACGVLSPSSLSPPIALIASEWLRIRICQ
jgi:hypothetical protein